MDIELVTDPDACMMYIMSPLAGLGGGILWRSPAYSLLLLLHFLPQLTCACDSNAFQLMLKYLPVLFCYSAEPESKAYPYHGQLQWLQSGLLSSDHNGSQPHSLCWSMEVL